MAILQLTTDTAGTVDDKPRIVRLLSTDSYATIITPGYLNSSVAQGFIINTTDIVLAQFGSVNPTITGIFVPSISSNIVTLNDYIGTKIAAGSGVTITNNGGDYIISQSGAGVFAWTVVTGTTQAMVSNNGYISSNVGLVSLSLPSGAAIGDEIDIIGQGAGGWTIAQPVGVRIRFGNASTTVGVGGSLSSTLQRDSCFLLCTIANVEWTAYAVTGNLTIV